MAVPRVQGSTEFVPFLGKRPTPEWIESLNPETHGPNRILSAELPLVPKPFPAPERSRMTFLPIAGVILLALWLVETIVFLVGYRQSNSKSS
jgi:hypothetical protein